MLSSDLEAPPPVKVVQRVDSAVDHGTSRYVLELSDTSQVETVLMLSDSGYVRTCISSQVGCSVGCLFCQTGQDKFGRNMSSAEIAGQVFAIEREIEKTVDRVGFMGMGEPLLNADAVFSAIDMLKFAYPARFIALSTVGYAVGLQAILDLRVPIDELFISVHAASPEVRARLIPARKWSDLEASLTVVRKLQQQRNTSLVINYLLFDGLNDTPADAERLTQLVHDLPCVVNVKEYNPIPAPAAATLRQSPQIEWFSELLERKGLTVGAGRSLGVDVDAGCGQLRRRSLKVLS